MRNLTRNWRSEIARVDTAHSVPLKPKPPIGKIKEKLAHAILIQNTTYSGTDNLDHRHHSDEMLLELTYLGT